MDKQRYQKSNEWLARALQVIPGQTQTFSKSYLQFSQGASPLYAVAGDGAYLYDVDDNTYIDFTMALCPCILGYNHPIVTEAVERQLRQAVILTLPHPNEIILSEKLTEIIPCAEMVRFGKNGSDATTAAIRVGRAYTGREGIAVCGYHGWHDWYIATTPRNRGIPDCVKELTHTFIYNDISSLEKLFAEQPVQIGTVMLEAIGLEKPTSGFLESVLRISHENGAIVVFDEIINGFRFALGGAQEYLGVRPDLSTFGKSMANGMPISVLAGSKEIMKLFEDIPYSTTFGGELLSIAASVATIDFLIKENVVDYVWAKGEAFKNNINSLIDKHGLDKVLGTKGYGPRWIMTFTDNPESTSWEIKTFFQQESATRGLLFSGNHNMCLAHNDQLLQKAAVVYDEVMALLSEALREGPIKNRLQGSVLEPVYRKA